jgi:uncharacterized protein (DUF1330 family)
MAAYIIAEVEVTDLDGYERYKPIVQQTLGKYGGRFLVRGGAAEALEGAAPQRIVVLEFPDAKSARAWYRSEEYAPGLKLRLAAARSRLILAEGVPPT